MQNMPFVSVKRHVKVRKFDAARKLRNPNFVAKAFFQALVDNDVDAALDALNGYLLAIGKSEIAKKEEIASSTVYHALSRGANPTLKTVAKLLHATV